MKQTERILELCADGKTLRELSEDLERPIEIVNAAIQYIRKQHPGKLHISAWRRVEYSTKSSPVAVWKTGQKKDAKKPPRLTRSQTMRRYREKFKLRPPSIFHLGMDPGRLTIAQMLSFNQTFAANDQYIRESA